MIWERPLKELTDRIKTHPDVTGIVLFGSLASDDTDAFSDIDLGITTRDNEVTLDEVYQVRYEFLDAVGLPIHTLDRSWEHCKMIAALFSKLIYPPIGLEIDLVFSQAQHAYEQFQYTSHKILYDSTGSLQQVLESKVQAQPTSEHLIAEISTQLSAFPFYLYEGLKSYHRGDMVSCHSFMADIHLCILKVAAATRNEILFSTKQATRFLSPPHDVIFEQSFPEYSLQTFKQLVMVFKSQFSQVDAKFHLIREIEDCRRGIEALVE